MPFRRSLECVARLVAPDSARLQQTHELLNEAYEFARNIAARNGTEPLPWDGWGLSDLRSFDALSADEIALIDAVAAATDEEARRLHTDPRLAVPREILSLAPFHGLRTVTLPQAQQA